MNFGSRTPTSHYKLSTSCPEWDKHTKYLGEIIHSVLKFDQHINDKCLKSRKLLGGIKHSKEAKLLAYTDADPYSNMQMLCGTLWLEERFTT